MRSFIKQMKTMISRNDKKHVRKDKVHLLRFVTGCFLFHSLLSTFKTEIGKTAWKSLQDWQ